MGTIHVSTHRPYDVLVSTGSFSQLGRVCAQVIHGRKAMLVTDSQVWELYGKAALLSLEQWGFTPFSFIFPQGEPSKNSQTYVKLLGALGEAELDRRDCIVALGGGVTGDLAGFAAATYLRGIPYIQVPTTLLAMVDSSVGGKTGIDLPQGKNLAGAFYQPALVLCDPELLNTLSPAVYQDGWAEVIKYALLGNHFLLESLFAGPEKQNMEAVIEACVSMKRDIVCQDEYDTGKRQALNLGHTLGHAIEAASDYKISHGQAVSMGMAMMLRAAVHLGHCPRKDGENGLALLASYGLPTKSPYFPRELCVYAARDKKRHGDVQTLVVPTALGNYRLLELTTGDLLLWAEAGGQEL